MWLSLKQVKVITTTHAKMWFMYYYLVSHFRRDKLSHVGDYDECVSCDILMWLCLEHVITMFHAKRLNLLFADFTLSDG